MAGALVVHCTTAPVGVMLVMFELVIVGGLLTVTETVTAEAVSLRAGWEQGRELVPERLDEA